MTDFTAISSALTAVKTATEIAKLLRESDRSLEKAELKLKLAEIISALADAKVQIADFRDVLEERDTRIKELEGAFAAKDTLARRHDAMYRLDESGEPKGDPYCLRCWTEDHKQRPLIASSVHHGGRFCPVCKTLIEFGRAQTI